MLLPRAFLPGAGVLSKAWERAARFRLERGGWQGAEQRWGDCRRLGRGRLGGAWKNK